MNKKLSREKKQRVEGFCRLANLSLRFNRTELKSTVQTLVNQIQELFKWPPRQAQELLWELGLLTKKRRVIGLRTLCSYVRSLEDIRCVPTQLRPPSMR